MKYLSVRRRHCWSLLSGGIAGIVSFLVMYPILFAAIPGGFAVPLRIVIAAFFSILLAGTVAVLGYWIFSTRCRIR